MRRPKSGLGSWLTPKAKPSPTLKEPPAPRRLDFEQRLCKAIRECVRVELRYDDDFATRLFEPTAVYWSSQDKVCVAGTQVLHPDVPSSALEPRNFEVGNITSLTLTEVSFVPDRRFDRFDPKYERGIVCSV